MPTAGPCLSSGVLAAGRARSGRYQVGLVCVYDRLDPIAQAELRKQSVDMRLHSRLRHVQPFPDLSVRQRRGNQREHFQFPIGEGGELVRIIR